MSGVVVFNVAAFIVQYPAFSVAGARLQGYFDTATLFLNNTVSSRVSDLTKRSMYLNMLVAHLAELDGVRTPEGAGSQAGKVGRVSSVTEGSVKADLAMTATPGTAAWYMQTQYGATYWTVTAPYRSMRYLRK